MIKPLLNDYERFIIINYPNTPEASFLRLELALTRFKREVVKIFIPLTRFIKK